MENASKALIIAGAILLSILIIGLGMKIYNSATSAAGSGNLDAQEIQAHNSQFLSYEGKQSGTAVSSLITLIKSNNRDYTDRMVGIGMSDSTTHGTVPAVTASTQTDPNTYDDINGKIKNKTTYFVTFTKGDNGCINGAEIHVYSNAD